MTGALTISARVTAQTKTDSNAKAGVMLRADAGASAAYYAFYVTAANGLAVQYRSSSGYSTIQRVSVPGSTPAYLRVSRWGTKFTAYISADGVAWQAVLRSPADLPAIGKSLSAGLFVTSNNPTEVSTASIDSVLLMNDAVPPPDACPAGWNCGDVGFAAPQGDQFFLNNSWIVEGGGADIWNTFDRFRFISQPLAADGFITAHVLAEQNTDGWAKAGAMFRLNRSPGAPYYAVLVTPGNGLVVQFRESQNGETAQIPISGSAPVWLRVVRTGPVVTAYTSADGVTWKLAPGSQMDLAFGAGSIEAGLAVCSHNTTALNDVSFDHVAVTTGSWPIGEVIR
jgi:hypothetical protein